MAAPKKSSKKNIKPQIAEGDSRFFCHDGNVYCTIAELSEALLMMSDDVFSHHSNAEKCDFASWVSDIFGKKQVANKMKKVAESREEMYEVLKEMLA